VDKGVENTGTATSPGDLIVLDLTIAAGEERSTKPTQSLVATASPAANTFDNVFTTKSKEHRNRPGTWEPPPRQRTVQSPESRNTVPAKRTSALSNSQSVEENQQVNNVSPDNHERSIKHTPKKQCRDKASERRKEYLVCPFWRHDPNSHNCGAKGPGGPGWDNVSRLK
jgi:hypothetical protein